MGGRSQDLWLSAMDKLDDADKQRLITFGDITSPSQRLDVLDGFGQTTREAYEICVRKRWSFKLPGEQGKRIIVRDLIGKITHWLEVFKGIGDQAVNFDPAFAALPWAGARFLLQIAINDFAKFDFVVEAAERISRMTSRYRIIEKLYLRRASEATGQLEQALVTLYATTLTYLAKAKRYFEENTALRILHSGLLAKSDLHDLLNKLESHEKEADRCTLLVEAEVNKDAAAQIADLSLEIKQISALREALVRIDRPILNMSHQLDRVEDHLDNLQRREILDWISSQRYGDYHRAIKDRVLEGTCGWIVQHPEFMKWNADSTSSLLWLHGTQGVGKSCLTSVIIEDCMQFARLDRSCALAYFYCSRNTSEPQRADPQRILACIARQLSSASPDHPIAPATLALYDRLRSVDGSREVLTMSELVELILELTNLYSRTTVILDALDECDPETRWKLVDALNDIVADSTGLVKVFISSREEGDLRLSIQDHTGVQMTALENNKDIQKFVEIEAERMVSKRQILGRVKQPSTKEDLKQLIKQDVVSKANGMFRWAELQLASLRGIQFEKDIRYELSRIPRDLDILYEDLYQKAFGCAKGTARAVMQNALKWLLCSRSTLPQKDFLKAITTFLDVDADEFDEDLILDLLSNFVVSYTTESGVESFQFAHLSVREFLEGKPEYSVQSSNSFAAEVSLLTLIGCSGSPNASRFIQELGLDTSTFIPFSDVESHARGIHDYCIRFWGDHCDLAGADNRAEGSKHLHTLLHYFLFDDSDESCPLSRWWRSYPRFLSRRSRSSAHMRHFFDDHERPCDRALYLACCYGFVEIVAMERHEAFNAHLQTECAMAAATHHQHSVLRSLLDPKSDSPLLQDVLSRMVALRDANGVREFLPLLEPSKVTVHMLSLAGSPEVVSMLLDHNRGLQVTTKMAENYGWANDTVSAYLARAPDLEITTGILQNAVGSMDFEAFKRLVDRADPAIITCHVIAEAVFKEHLGPHVIPMTELLLERAGNIEVTEDAMMQAVANNRNPKTLKKLIERGWPLSPHIIEFCALQATKETFQVLSEASCTEISPRLLELAAANVADGDTIVQLLMALLDGTVDNETWSRMLVRCARNTSRGLQTMDMLLRLKPNTKVVEKVFLAALAMNWDDHGMFNRILDGNRELEITDNVVRCALERLRYDEAIRKILDRHGCAIISCDMMLGAVRNRLYGDEMTKLLLHRDSMLEQPSAEVRTAVICNDHSGYEILQMLERRFGQFTFTDADLKSAASGSLKMLKLVLSRCGISRIPDSVLQVAVSRAHLDVLKHLLQLYDGPITREMVVAAAGNEGSGAEKFKLVWNLAPEVKPCPEMFIEAAANLWDDNLNLIMDRVEDESLYQTVLDAAVKSSTSCYAIVRTFLDRGVPIHISSQTVMDAMGSGNGRMLYLLLNDMAGFRITQDIVDLAVKREDLDSLLILYKQGSSMELDLQGVQQRVANYLKTAWSEEFDMHG
ncbi:hypothetical protein ASPVEDRAFT_327326 [Aspergillus versicolor CBS 583.65]|uniref:Uncharacterized protein n=1 Tax=Aspergillus versicolor CBS 583.65 TaxID=1036611 RepID=A0A1L9PYG9_ASPVE|nr:uncharacterized protein ASPVEDRAFT_327326 [Aspergillus versicolor CBS 583.65]OJJ06515.1 hypothetical protein ASPVEDRAFT_327326 [Aspergillus versicolor CBS 583.65]